VDDPRNSGPESEVIHRQLPPGVTGLVSGLATVRPSCSSLITRRTFGQALVTLISDRSATTTTSLLAPNDSVTTSSRPVVPQASSNISDEPLIAPSGKASSLGRDAGWFTEMERIGTGLHFGMYANVRAPLVTWTTQETDVASELRFPGGR
jgi:hypothetical protein